MVSGDWTGDASGGNTGFNSPAVIQATASQNIGSVGRSAARINHSLAAFKKRSMCPPIKVMASGLASTNSVLKTTNAAAGKTTFTLARGIKLGLARRNAKKYSVKARPPATSDCEAIATTANTNGFWPSKAVAIANSSNT